MIFTAFTHLSFFFVNDRAIHAYMPSKATKRVCTECTISTKYRASVSATPYKISIVLTAKCQGPAPFGVGTITAMEPTMNVTNAHDSPKWAVASKQKKVR